MSNEPNSEIASSVINKLLEHRQGLERQKEVIIENQEEWKKVLNRIFSTPDGEFFAKYLLRYLGEFKVDNSLNQIKLIEDNTKRKFYLELIRPYLDVEILTTIENQQGKK